MSNLPSLGGELMKKLVCKLCGNENVIMEYGDKVICRCGLVLRIPGVDGVNSGQERVIKASQKVKAELILQVSLLKREIDQCLDDRNKERFQKLSSQLKHLHEIVNTEILLMDKYTTFENMLDSIAFD
jgi:transcription initiation factor TFIIIB Brf1 subunit/transcription initiation factor TFIIB